MESPWAAISASGLLGNLSIRFANLDLGVLAHPSWQIAHALSDWMEATGEQQFSSVTSDYQTGHSNTFRILVLYSAPV